MSANDWVVTLLRATLEGGALLFLIWIVTRLWPRMPAAARCGLWWVGSLRMLVGLVQLPRIPVAWKPAVTTWVPDLRTPAVELGNAMAGGVVSPVTTAPARVPVDLIPLAIVALWAAGAAIALVILTRRLLALRRTWRTAQRFDDPRNAAWQAEWAVALGRGRVPEVRVSADVEVPMVFGALRPGLLLPADSSRLSDDALRMVLAHEMSHVRRGDPLLGWVPAAAQIVFWFFPPVRFAAREYLAAREQVSDADALRDTGVSPHDYGALLLDYGVGRLSEMPGVASCGSGRTRDLKRRLDMLSMTLRVPPSHRAVAAFITFAVVALAFAPIRFVAAGEGKSTQSSESKKKSEYDSQWQTEKQLEAMAKAQADWQRQMEKAAQRADEKLAYQQAYGKEHRKRSPIAYMVKLEGENGTRGSIDEMDMDAARSLDYRGRSAVYFRLDNEAWISHDERTIESVLRTIEPEMQMDEKMRVSEGHRQAYERERMKLEERRMEIEFQKAQVEERRRMLLEKIEDARPSDKALEEKALIDNEMQSLWDEERSLHDAMGMLYARQKSAYTQERVPYAERDKVHQRVLEEVAKVARRAIADKRAERFAP